MKTSEETIIANDVIKACAECPDLLPYTVEVPDRVDFKKLLRAFQGARRRYAKQLRVSSLPDLRQVIVATKLPAYTHREPQRQRWLQKGV